MKWFKFKQCTKNTKTNKNNDIASQVLLFFLAQAALDAKVANQKKTLSPPMGH